MQLRHLRFFPAICLISIVLSSVIANVYAGAVNITNVQYPNSVTYGSTGTINIDVSFDYRASQLGVVGVSVYDLSKGTLGAINGTDVIVTGSPYPPEQLGNPPSCTGSITAGMDPVPLLGKETIRFTFSTSHVPAVSVWQLSASAVLMPDFSVSHKEFTISVTIPSSLVTSTTTTQASPTTYTYSPTSNALTSYTPYFPTTATSTASLQMPQPPQQTATPTLTNYTLSLALAVVIAAVALGALLLYRRKGQPKVTQAKIDTYVTPLSTTKTIEGKRLCIECGNELPPNLMFCNNCGVKQP